MRRRPGSSGSAVAVIAAWICSTSAAKPAEFTSRGYGSGFGITCLIRPGCDEMMTIRLAMNTASAMLWVTKKMLLMPAWPDARQSSTTSVRRFSAVSTSSALNGSSMQRISGRATSARAKPTRWRMPPDSSFG